MHAMKTSSHSASSEIDLIQFLVHRSIRYAPNACSKALRTCRAANCCKLIDNRLIDDRVHHVAVVPADRPGRLRHEDHHQLLVEQVEAIGP